MSTEITTAPLTASSMSVMMDDAALNRVSHLAEIMASSKATIPVHLRSHGDCFAVCLQSMQWGMNPFAVAQKTFLVNGTLGYEAQLVAAVINNSGLVTGRFKFHWDGPWENVIGKYKEIQSKRVLASTSEDEEGCYVEVSATLKGETEPTSLKLYLTQARTRNSTLWADDPKQQLAYLAQKRWARLYAPDVLLGVYTPDELSDAPRTIDMGQAEVVQAQTPAQKPALPDPYSEDEFNANLPKWTQIITSNRKSAEELVAFISSKRPLTAEQQQTLLAVKPQQAGEAQQPPLHEDAPVMTYAEVADQLHKADGLEELATAASKIAYVRDAEQRDQLTEIYNRLASDTAF